MSHAVNVGRIIDACKERGISEHPSIVVYQDVLNL